MKIKRKMFICIIIAIILLVCLVPVRAQRVPAEDEFISYQEGRGTFIYSAILYKVIVWDEMYLESIWDSSFKKRKGTDIYIFPFNFGDKEWRDNKHFQY